MFPPLMVNWFAPEPAMVSVLPPPNTRSAPVSSIIPLTPWANLIVLPDGALLMHQRSDPTPLLSCSVVTSVLLGWANTNHPAIPSEETNRRPTRMMPTSERGRCVALARRNATSFPLGILRAAQGLH